MPKLTLGGIQIDVDENGFIQEPEKWSEAVAEDLARIENATPLDADRWKLVNFMRAYYLEYGTAPPIRMLLKKTGMDLQHLFQLFPGGPIRGVCKVAGLPRPDGCV